MVAITVSEFEQGGFYVNNGQDYSSSTEIRSGWFPIENTAVTVECGDLKWSFICRDSEGVFHNISESSGYKSSGETIALTAYPWIAEIRIELSGTNLSPPQTCTLLNGYVWSMGAVSPVPMLSVDLTQTSMKSPYPDSLWRIDGGLPYTNLMIDLPETSMKSPYPDSLWRIDSNINDGLPYTKLMTEPLDFGAFANAGNLVEVSIPRSVKKIGRQSFKNTKLKIVMIASDCTYYPTSFPQGCTINFYPD